MRKSETPSRVGGSTLSRPNIFLYLCHNPDTKEAFGTMLSLIEMRKVSQGPTPHRFEYASIWKVLVTYHSRKHYSLDWGSLAIDLLLLLMYLTVPSAPPKARMYHAD